MHLIDFRLDPRVGLGQSFECVQEYETLELNLSRSQVWSQQSEYIFWVLNREEKKFCVMNIDAKIG